MGFYIGRDREVRRAYGFDEVALVPGNVTINPEDVNVNVKIGDLNLKIPFFSSAMDGVTDVNFAIKLAKLGGVGVLNLEGIYTRYENPQSILEKIASVSQEESTKIIQSIYNEPVKEELIYKRIKEIKDKGAIAAVSAIPQKAERYGKIAQEAGCDLFVVQATVVSVRHLSTKYKGVDLKKLCSQLKMPVIIGNCVTYDTALELMDTGCVGILVGIGPGTACTTRGVLGIGVPQVTATIDCAAAREFYFKKTGKYVSIITDGGMSTGGDICKAFASGADSVMLGSAFARAQEAPGKGYHWGMATPDPYLPRGTRIKVGITGTLEQILFGPANLDDGTQNLVGALTTSMGNLGANNIKQMQLVEIIIAPGIQTEGKVFQRAQKVGMGK